MNVNEIMNLLDEELLKKLGEQYKINKSNNKITGEFILMSFVRNVLLNREISLRTIEEMTSHSDILKKHLKTTKNENKKIDHSSLGKRLRTIDPNYFKSIYENIIDVYGFNYSNNRFDKLHRFDSTVIGISGKLLKEGFYIGGNHKNNTKQHIKITISLKNSIPLSARFCDKREDLSEDIALVKAINETKLENESIILFDRGIGKTATFEDFSQRKINFITRINTNRNYKILKNNPVKESGNKDLKILSDQIIYLYGHREKIVKCELRLIKAINKSGNELRFLTNLLDLSSFEVAESYKRRWDIEIFFKFLKSQLQFKNFISYSQNGMSVYLYCILIAAILFTIFKLKNKLSGFKIPLLRFTLELEKEIIKTAVILSGGNPNLIEKSD